MFPPATIAPPGVAANGSTPRQTSGNSELAITMPKQRFRNRAPRVLHLVDSLNIGGTENQMACLALRMRHVGHRVTVGCLRVEGPLLQVLQRAGIPVVEFRKGKTLLSLNGVRQVIHLAAFLSGRFDVVHAHDLWS